MPHIELLINNGLAERVESEHIRWRITGMEKEALRHIQELERLMPKIAIEEGLARVVGMNFYRIC